MVFNGEVCPNCGGRLKYYDSVSRIQRTKNRETHYISIRRLVCCSCKRIHREIPESVVPYAQYEKELITAVQEGIISETTLGYEDYPCNMTMSRWRSRYLQCLL